MTTHFGVKRAMAAGAGLLGIVLLAFCILLLITPGRSLAQEPAPGDSQPAEAAGVDEANNPDAAIGSSLLDFHLPGTQPGGLSAALADSTSCTGCHVDHMRDNFNGAMMTNGVRDPLFRAALVIASKDANYGGELCIRCHSPNAWLNNRSAIPGNPASTDGRLINAEDLHGISCSACHRMVPTTAMSGEASGDAAERAALTGPFMHGSGAYIVDRTDVRRGPFSIASAPHAVAQSSFLRVGGAVRHLPRYRQPAADLRCGQRAVCAECTQHTGRRRRPPLSPRPQLQRMEVQHVWQHGRERVWIIPASNAARVR